MRINIKYSAMLFAAVFAFSALCPPAMRVQADGAPKAADAYNQNDYQKLAAFLEIADAAGVKNGMKLSASYDVLDPTTWGVDASGEPRFGWTEKAGKLSLQSVNCPNIVGGLCGILDLGRREAVDIV